MTEIVDHDAYITESPEQFRETLRTLRAQLAAALPDAEEMIAYGMPGFRLGTAVVASYAAFTRQCGLYLAPGAIALLAEELDEAGLRHTKSGVTFSASSPIPEPLVTRLAVASRDAIGE